jgi:uncharacterized protein (DUF488 family)
MHEHHSPEMPTPKIPDWPEGTIFTVGHSTLPLESFIGLLQAYGIERLADIRTIPRSRRNPQFNADTLPVELAKQGIEYQPMPELGGLRHARKDSPNMGWRNDSFRGYADYMQTAAFAEAVEILVKLGREKRTAIMCAEAVPWRCHRSLVADALLVRGVPVAEILSATDWRPHKLTGFAAVDGLSVTYPPEQQSLL